MNRAYDLSPYSSFSDLFHFESDVVSCCVMIERTGLMYLIDVVVVILFHVKS